MGPAPEHDRAGDSPASSDPHSGAAAERASHHGEHARDGAAHRATAKHERALERQARVAERRELEAARAAERAQRGPGPWRTVVLPLLRLGLVAIIAVALVKLAFFPDPVAADQAEVMPGAVMEEPLVEVTRGSISNDLELEGSVVAAAGEPVRASIAGEVSHIDVEDGDVVAEGDRLFVITTLIEATEPNDDGSMPEPSRRFIRVNAPADGVVRGFDLMLGQAVDVGTDAGSVAPPRFRFVASLAPEQQYRLTQEPAEAELQINSGPAPFTCSDVVIVPPEEPADGGGGAPVAADGGGSDSTVECDIPQDVRVFAGLAGTMTLAAGSVSDVLVLPTTAVIGDVESGVVTTRAEDGTQQEIEVVLGLSDGELVEIRSGLEEGDTVMEFAPGESDVPEECLDPALWTPEACGDVPPPMGGVYGP